MEKYHQQLGWKSPQNLMKSAVVTALYIVLTLLFFEASYGPVQFRVSEGLNYLGLYNKRYIWAVTLGVFVVNAFKFGPVDMIVGSLSSLVFIWLGRLLAEWVVERGMFKAWDETVVKYVILAVVFTLSMFTIALELVVLAKVPFWETYVSLMIGEGSSLLFGGIMMYFVSKRIDFNE